MTRVLLTGANGFVGRQIGKALADAGHEVIALVRRGAAGNALFPARRIETDDLFREPEAALRDMAAEAEVIVHAAWYAEAGLYQHALANLDCLTGTVRLAQAAIEAGVRRFVGVGTCFEYDFARAERAGAFPLAPDAPLGPNTIYGATKAAACLALEQAFARSDASFAWCRLFYLFGAGEDPRRLAPYVAAKLSAGEPAELSEGTQIRDFLDVAEAGRRIADVALATGAGPVNICSGEAVSVRDFLLSRAPADADLRLLKFGARPMRPDEPPRVVGRPGGLAAKGWGEGI